MVSNNCLNDSAVLNLYALPNVLPNSMSFLALSHQHHSFKGKWLVLGVCMILVFDIGFYVLYVSKCLPNDSAVLGV